MIENSVDQRLLEMHRYINSERRGTLISHEKYLKSEIKLNTKSQDFVMSTWTVRREIDVREIMS